MTGRVNIGGVEIDIRADGSLLVADLKRAEAQAKAFANSASASMGAVGASVGGLMQNVKLLGASLLTLGVGAGFASSIKLLADFGQTMSTVRAITGATGAEFAALEASAKRLGATTRFSATQAAEGMALLGQAGFTTNEILSAIGPTLDLAQAGGLGLAQAAEISSSTLRGFGLEVSQTARVMDVLAKASVISNADVTSLGEGMKFAAPTAKALGIELEEATAIIAKLADAGLTGGLGGRGFQSVATQLVSQRDKIKAIIGDYDLATEGISQVVRRLTQAGITTQQVIDIFRGENLDVFSVLQEATREAGKGVDAYRVALENSGGTAREISKVMDENLNGAILQASSSFEALVLAIGEAGATEILIGLFRSLGDVLSYVAGLIGDVTNSVSEGISQTADEAKASIDKMVETQNKIVSDIADLTIANETLNEAIKDGGEAAIIAAQQDVNAINSRIVKNKELLNVLRAQAQMKLRDAEDALAKTQKPGDELDRLLFNVPQSAPKKVTYPAGALGNGSPEFSRVEPGRVPRNDAVLFGRTTAGAVNFRSALNPDGTISADGARRVQGAYGTRENQLANAKAAIDEQLKQRIPLTDTQRLLQDYIFAKTTTEGTIKGALDTLEAIDAAVAGETSVVLPGGTASPTKAASKPAGGGGAEKKALEFQIYTSALEDYRAALEAINAAAGTEEEKSRGRLAALIAYNDAAENTLLTLNELAALNANGDLLPDQNRVIQKILDDQLKDSLNERLNLDFSDSEAAFQATSDNASARLAAMADQGGGREGYWDSYANDVANATKRGLYNAIQSGDYGDLLENVIGDAAADGLSRAVDQMVDLLFDLLSDKDIWKSVFGSGDVASGVGSFFSSIFGGNKASGGDMRAGRAYRVGEMGAELFVPRTDGFMIPNQAAMTIGGGADRNIVQVGDTIIHVGSMGAGVTLEQLERTLAAHRRELPQAIDARIANRRIVGAY